MFINYMTLPLLIQRPHGLKKVVGQGLYAV